MPKYNSSYKRPGHGKPQGDRSGGRRSRPGGGRAGSGSTQQQSMVSAKRGNYDASNGQMRKAKHRTGADRFNGKVR